MAVIKFRINSSGYVAFGKKGVLHRSIWELINGPIPDGFHIHHIDGNKLNNNIENLQCLSHAEHLSLHMTSNKKLHLWHRTEEGRQLLSINAKKIWKNRKVHSLK